METDEGDEKNKRAGRRSMWWRLQEVKNGGFEVLVRCLLIILSITPAYLFADESNSFNPVEDLIRLKKQLILEHMAGDGETKLQGAIQQNLDKNKHDTINSGPQGINRDRSLTREMVQKFEQQYETPENCETWKNNAHMVDCINHKMRSKDKFFETKKN